MMGGMPESLATIKEILYLLDEHAEAIAYDCLGMGLRLRNLGTEEFSWGDLLVIIKQAPRSSAFYRALHPEEVEWGLTEQLLALNADYTAVLAWQNGGGKQRDYPKPIPRPGVKPDKERFGKEAIEIEEMAAWLGWEQPEK